MAFLNKQKPNHLQAATEALELAQSEESEYALFGHHLSSMSLTIIAIVVGAIIVLALVGVLLCCLCTSN